MIPQFPEFKSIELSDQVEIEELTKNYPPYSDFNFVSLFCWDIEGKRKISILNGNLVVLSTDDVSGREFLSFIGLESVVETAEALLKYARKRGLRGGLRMVPEEIAIVCFEGEDKFIVKEDRNNFDYICSIDGLACLCGGAYSTIRKAVKKFERAYGERAHCEFIKGCRVGEVLDIWQRWLDTREDYSINEQIALQRTLEMISNFNVLTAVAYVDEKPVAFSINQIIDSENIISHFAKADYSYRGSLLYLDNKTAQYFVEKGYRHVNYEEDMGLPSLRYAKIKYSPVRYLKKFTIREKRSIIMRYIAKYL